MRGYVWQGAEKMLVRGMGGLGFPAFSSQPPTFVCSTALIEGSIWGINQLFFYIFNRIRDCFLQT